MAIQIIMKSIDPAVFWYNFFIILTSAMSNCDNILPFRQDFAAFIFIFYQN